MRRERGMSCKRLVTVPVSPGSIEIPGPTSVGGNGFLSLPVDQFCGYFKGLLAKNQTAQITLYHCLKGSKGDKVKGTDYHYGGKGLDVGAGVKGTD